MSVDPAALTYDADGLLPVVVQDVPTGAVLMLAYANREAVERTQESGAAWFWSRSRGELWEKGATSGNRLHVTDVRADCDGDALLYRVDRDGPACHTGARSCFEQPADGPGGAALELGWLWRVLESRRGADPEASYTARLLAAGVERAARKVGEEATETVIAALGAGGEDGGDEDGGDHLTAEAADLLYHLLVLLLAAGGEVTPERVATELRRRHARPSTPETSKPEER